jgi:type IV secretory pathway TrbF-like protein
MEQKQTIRERKYFEIFGDSANWVMFLRSLVIILLIIIVFLITMLSRSVNKPPLVVKVDKIGRAEAIENWESKTAVSVPEIANFTQTFTELWLRWDFYTYLEDFTKAAFMMTEQQQKNAQEYLNANKVEEQIKTVQARGKVYITQIEVKKDSKESVLVAVRGYREVYSYLNPDFKKETVFEIEIVAKKVKRTNKAPWGLLVDFYKEDVFKEK